MPSPLYSPDLEKDVLAACFMGKHPSDVPYLRPEHFKLIPHQHIWRLMLQSDAEGAPIAGLELVERLKHTACIEQDVNWEELITQLNYNLTGSAALFSFESNAETVYDYWRRRQIVEQSEAAIEQAQQAAALASNLARPLPPDEALHPAAKRTWTTDEILDAVVPAPKGPWKGVIPPGLTLLGARPKSGKSVLMMQLAIALGCGGMHFGERVEPRQVLYYALEDDTGRLQTRLVQMGMPRGTPVTWRTGIAPLYEAGMKEVLEATDRFGLIVIDTIERATPGKDFTKDSALYAKLMGEMQSAALSKNMSIVAVVHRRKQQVGSFHFDPVDDVLGSTQLTTAADCVLCIYREEADEKHKRAKRPKRAQLLGRARDLPDIDLTMAFDPPTLCWQKVEEEAEAEEEEETEAEKQILEALKGLGKVKASTIANAVGAHRGNTSTRLQKLWKEGKVRMELIDNIAYYFLEEIGGTEDKNRNTRELMLFT